MENTMTEINLATVDLTWCIDIIKRIQAVLDTTDTTDDEKIQILKWLVKQGLKVERED